MRVSTAVLVLALLAATDATIMRGSDVCKTGQWGKWGPCSKSCGPGESVRYRAITSMGVNCPATAESERCQLEPCGTPMHCHAGPWTAWSACSTSCGPGESKRTREVRNCTVGAPMTVMTEKCQIRPCSSMRCQYTDWSSWDSCTVSCGGGTQHRTRTALSTPKGQKCTETKDSRRCNRQFCPGPTCKVSDWGAWSECSATCGRGQQSRTRAVIVSGFGCPVTLESRPCNIKRCPGSHCQTSEWSSWSPCSKSCGAGKMSRVRTIIAHAKGEACHVQTAETEYCNTEPCSTTAEEEVVCGVSQWSDWAPCSASCGGGSRSRDRTITRMGFDCPATAETSLCNTNPCPINCEVGDWGMWSACSKSCGGGKSTRSRPVIVEAQYGGIPCPMVLEQKACNMQPCRSGDLEAEVACMVSDWSEWGKCSTSCGGGIQSRQRTIVKAGFDCPALTESRVCNAGSCPVDCIVGEWGAWSPCSKSCGGGMSMRERTITRMPQFGGLPCPPLVQKEACNVNKCP